MQTSTGTLAAYGFNVKWRDLCLFFLALALVCLKSNDALTFPQLWAEDAAVFLKQQIEQKGLLLFTPYAGYLHAVPRLVAWSASFVSTVHAPLIYNACAIVIAALSVAVCARNLSPAIPSSLVLGVFLLSPTSGEVFGTITNVQWFLQFPLITYCFIATRSGGRVSRIALNLLLVLAALTGPFSIICTLLMAMSLGAFIVVRLTRSTKFADMFIEYFEGRDLLTWALVAVAACIQLSFLYSAGSAHADGISLHRLVVGSLGQAAPLHMLGFNPLRPVLWPVGFVGMAVYLLFFSRLAFATRIGLTLVLAVSIVEVLAAGYKTGVEPLMSLLNGDRYFFALKTVAWWLLFVVLKDLLSSGRQAATCTLLFLIFVCMLNQGHMIRPALTDNAAAASLEALDRPGTQTLKVDPQGWEVTIDRKE